MEEYDVAIVGAGFGGLGAAVRLAESGARVVLLEQLRYPGGCASTFTRGGARYESGATLFSGFGEGQLFRRWIDSLKLEVRFESTDPLVELRAPGLAFKAAPRRALFVDRMVALPGVPEKPTRAFFAEQQRIADVLWELLDSPELLPPLSFKSVIHHLRRLPSYLPVLRWVTRPLRAVLNAYGLSGVKPLETYLNAVCQITVQCGIDDVEAPFALGAMDYYFRGTGHISGGIGVMATAVTTALQERNVRVRYSTSVKRITRHDDHYTLETRRGAIRSRHVIANLTPHAAQRLLSEPLPRLERLAKRVESGWGAAMLYRRLRTGELRQEPHHLELIARPEEPLIEGNHVFCSLSGTHEGRTSNNERTLTVSTHIDASKLRRSDDPQVYVEHVQARMRATITSLAPELDRLSTFEMTGSPRTFARFTGRDHGFVGGVPRRAGITAYGGLFARPIARGFHLVGDSVFPGQSALAAAIGGERTAQRVLKRL